MKVNRPETTFSGKEVCALSARQTVDLLRKGEVSPDELIGASEERSAQVDEDVNALVSTCFDRARERVSKVSKSSDDPGWLAGLPIGIKDLSGVKGVRTTMGTLALADYVSTDNDPIVEILEARDGLVVGKTNSPEMGAGGNTYNAVSGITRNPWDTRKNSGGSSGGAAVSLAAGEVWLSHGSDLAGSLRTPASYCGVVGLRPTPGRAFGGPLQLGFSGEGISGPMARSVEDCALFLDAMCGFDERAPLSLPAPDSPFLRAVDQASPNVKIAYAPTLDGFSPVEQEIEQIMRHALETVQSEGATIVEDCPNMTGLYDSYVTLRGLTMASLPGRAPSDIQKHYKRTLADNIQFGRDLTSENVIDAGLNRTALYHRMREFLHGHDVLACAVAGLEPTPVEVEFPTEVDGKPMADYIDWLRFSFLATTTGLPAISVPCGFTKSGMPVGIQLIGPPRGDAKVLAVARVIEQVLDLGTSPIDPIVRHC